MESLNCRMEAKPAAKAMSAMAMSVVSMSTRADWARRLRAMASGPAPSSSVTMRFTCRVL